MGKPFPYNAVQKAREFLSTLDVHTPAFAGSGEVLYELTDRVKTLRNDPVAREKILELVEELRDMVPEQVDGLPDGIYNEADPKDLAWELSALIENHGPAMQAHPRMLALLMILAMLLFTLAMGPACAEDNDGEEWTNDSEVCTDDLGVAHFADFLNQADDLTDDQKTDAIEEYVDLGEEDQEQVIANLCQMTAEGIAEYIESVFSEGSDGINYDDDNDDPSDATPVYKGVAF